MRFLWRVLLIVGVALPASATVTTITTPTVTYSPSVNTNSFAVTFPFDMATDLVVTKITDVGGAETILTYLTHYTVRLPVDSTNGSIYIFTAVTSDYSIRIERDTDPTQLRSFRRQGTYNADQLERMADRTVMALQDAVFTAGESADDAVATHAALSDPHTGYAKLLGRAGGQTLIGGSGSGGENLVLQSNAASNGLVRLGSGVYVDDAQAYLGISTSTPAVPLHVIGAGLITGDLTLQGGAGALTFSGSTSSVLMDDNDASALDMGATGATSILRFDTTNNSEALHVDGYMYIGLDTTNRLYIDTDSDEGFVTLVGSGNDSLLVSAGVLAEMYFYEASHATYPNGINLKSAHARFTGGSSLTDGDSAVVTVFGKLHGAMHEVNALAGAVGTVDSVDDCRDIILAATDNTVVSLPEISPATEPPSTFDGCEVTVINAGADGAALVSVSPNGTDTIVGSCVGVTGAGAATVVEFSGGAGKDALNTKATANNGDYIKLVSYATSDIWFVTGCVGEWASEP